MLRFKYQTIEFDALHAKPPCKIIIVDPGRQFHTKFSSHMMRLGYSHTKSKYDNIENNTQPVRGVNNYLVLTYQR